MCEIREIRDQLVSEDIGVLEQSLRFASARGAQEAQEALVGGAGARRELFHAHPQGDALGDEGEGQYQANR